MRTVWLAIQGRIQDLGRRVRQGVWGWKFPIVGQGKAPAGGLWDKSPETDDILQIILQRHNLEESETVFVNLNSWTRPVNFLTPVSTAHDVFSCSRAVDTGSVYRAFSSLI